MISKNVMTSEEALKALQAAQEEARAHQWTVPIAVYDDAGHLLGFVRMPGANIASATISQSKAAAEAVVTG